ncbi:MAG TPA: EthD domain-containing protein, partial [Actinomycetota bacterium]|nr:EthD domain-containing protein [Actinomycetota bacterium]
MTSPRRPTLMFEVYRWAGTTPEQFRKHYIEVHAQLGKKIPGIVWYETFLNEEPTADWQAQERPRPDAYVIMKLESEEVLAEMRNA